MNLLDVFTRNSQRQSKVISSGIYLPKQVVKSDHLLEQINSEKNYGIPANWMSKYLGIKERRMASPDAKPSDLAIPAARMAIESCDDIRPDEIDSVYFCGIERDMPEPATAHIIQNALGLNARTALDLSNACFGFVNGIEAATKDIKLGEARYALVVTSEVSTKVMLAAVKLLETGIAKNQAKMILGALTVGDAGGAVILGPSNTTRGFSAINKRTDSSKYPLCYYKMEGGQPSGRMDMRRITNAIYAEHQQMISSTFEVTGTEFDWALCHQTSAIQFGRIAKLAGLPESSVVKTFEKLGNIASASFPVGFNKLVSGGKVKRGDKVACCFSGSGISIGQFGYTF